MARVATASVHTPPAAREHCATAQQTLEAHGVLSEIDSDKQLEVTVMTIAADGCSFRSPVPFRPGATYTLRIGTGPLYLASTLQITCALDRNDAFFDVAAKFV